VYNEEGKKSEHELKLYTDGEPETVSQTYTLQQDGCNVILYSTMSWYVHRWLIAGDFCGDYSNTWDGLNSRIYGFSMKLSILVQI
jgi:hypothetical protein